MSLLIKSGRIVDPLQGLNSIADIRLNNSVVDALGVNIEPFPDDQILEIKFVEDDEVVFAVDGQISEYLFPQSKVLIRKSPFDIKMITFKDSNYFHTLSLKMGWGKRG